MTRTPWGDAERLRDRRLRPGPGTPRAEVERNQRERLMAAMVAAVDARGYRDATVAEVVGLSGVSRSAFYRHFANREECFLATAAEIVALALEAIAGRYRGDGPWEERGRDALQAFLELLVAQPAAARLVMVESRGTGTTADELVERATDDFVALARQALTQMPGRAGIPPRMVRAVIGGLREALQTRLHRRQEECLLALAPDLLEAMLAYRDPPAPLDGRARGPRTNGGPTGSAGLPPHDAADPAERIVAAATAAMGSDGYGQTSLDAVVARAGVSLSTLYEHFDGREAVLSAALDAGQERMFAAAAPAYRRARDWPEGVRAAIGAIFRFLAAEPGFARLGMVEVYGAGRETLELRAATVERFARFLDPGFERCPRAHPIAAELAVGAILSLTYEQVRDGDTTELPRLTPLATYIVLSPFLGSAEAGAVAVGARRRVATGSASPAKRPASDRLAGPGESRSSAR